MFGIVGLGITLRRDLRDESTSNTVVEDSLVGEVDMIRK
jgi:hypothetical protein